MGKEVEATATKQSGTCSATSAYLKKNGYESIEVDRTFPESVDGLVEAFGEKVVHSNTIAAMIVTLQGNIRRWAKAQIEKDGSVDTDALQAKADAWIPGVVSRTKKSKIDKGLDLAEGMQGEELGAYIKKLQERAAALSA